MQVGPPPLSRAPIVRQDRAQDKRPRARPGPPRLPPGGGGMSGPVVFVSHFAVKEGRREDLRELAAEISAQLEADKPGTAAYLMYLDEEGSRFTVAHCFPDAGAMDRHFEGSDDRTAAAFEVMVPLGWEI